MEFDFRNRLFRPDVPPSPRPVIQTAAHCVPPDKFPLLLSCPFPPRRFSPPRGITDYFVRPRSPFPPSFPPVDKDRDICDRSSDTARRTPPQYFASTSLPVSRVSTVSPLVFFSLPSRATVTIAVFRSLELMCASHTPPRCRERAVPCPPCENSVGCMRDVQVCVASAPRFGALPGATHVVLLGAGVLQAWGHNPART